MKGGKTMFGLTKVVLNINGKRFKFNRDKYGYFFDKTDEKKYRNSRTNFMVPIGNGKASIVEEYNANCNTWRIGHVELRNLAMYAQTAAVYFNKNGQEKRKNLKDPSDIEITIEDGIYMEDDE